MLANRSMPRATVIPTLPYPDVAEAIAWLQAAFDFRLRLRIGDHRAQMDIGDHGGDDGAMVVTRGEAGGGGAVMVRVGDVDAHHARAVAAGAQASDPASYPYGERQYSARDLAGHVWTFSQSIANIDPADWGGQTG